MAYNATNPNGQAAMAASSPVVIASDQAAISVKQNDFSAAGSLSAQNTYVTTSALQGVATATIQVSGTWVGLLTPQASVDGTNYISLNATGLINVNTGAYTATIASGGTGLWQSDIAGFNYFRLGMTTYTSGTAVITIKTTNATGAVAIDNPLPQGGNNIGIVSLAAGSSVTSSANDTFTSGSLTAAGNAVTPPQLAGISTATIEVTGTWAGVLTPQASVDNANWFAVSPSAVLNLTGGTQSGTIASAATGIWQVNVAGFNYFRVNMTTYTSGTAVVSVRCSAASGLVALNTPLPTGTNAIGSVTLGTAYNTIGIVGINPTTSTPGLTLTNQSQQALTATVVYVKTSTARLYEYDFYNPNSAGVWVQIFNAASGVTLGTTAPTRTIYIPATAGRDWASPYSMSLAAGLAIACTTTNTGSTAPTSAIQAYVGYI